MPENEVFPIAITLTTRFIDELVYLKWGEYSNGRIALEFLDREGAPLARATTNLPNEPLAPDEAFIPSHGENDGMVDALVKAGLIERTGRSVQSGHVDIEVCRWLVKPPDWKSD